MGASASKTELLSRLEEGGGAPGSGMRVLSPRQLDFINKALESHASSFNHVPPPPLLGLQLSFSKMFHPMFLNDPIILIKISLARQAFPPEIRVCSSRSFIRLLYGVLLPLYHQEVVKATGQGTEMETCPICMDRATNIVLPCGHAFCKVCEAEWMEIRSTCPLCRQVQSENEDWELTEQHVPVPAPAVDLLAKELFARLSQFPTLQEFYDVFPSPALAMESGKADRSMGNWLESQTLTDSHSCYCCCKQCFARVRVPPNAHGEDRLQCAACRKIFRVDDD